MQKLQQHQIDDMGWSSSHNSQNYKKQTVLCYMGDTLIPHLLGNTYKWNHSLDRNPCLHRIATCTNRKFVHICIHLFHFSSFVFTSFRPYHWCKNYLGHNKGYLWIYLLYLLQIIMGKNFDWSTTNITYGLSSNTLPMKRCFIVWDCAFGHIQIPTPNPIMS